MTSIRILVYSDNLHTREDVIRSVGRKIGDRSIDWTEAATHEGAILKVEEGAFDLLILDAEAGKLGGIGVGKTVRDEIDENMPYIILIARPQDRWLARVAKPEVILEYPSNPRDLYGAVKGIVDSHVTA